MSLLRITGGRPLRGTVRVQGAKNSVLPIMAAAILSGGISLIHNCPRLSDVDAAMRILSHLGCGVSFEGDTVRIDSRVVSRFDIPDSLMREMRSSVIFLGAILARKGKAVLSAPGGCELGPRPIDLHLASLNALGADISGEGGNVVCSTSGMTGCRINLAIPSVGATENTMLAASRAKGTTVLTNAACEPEIYDLQEYLRALGVDISGAGTPTVVIRGGDSGGDIEHNVLPDRIVASTYLAAAASAGGDITITDVCPEHFATVTDALREMGCRLIIGKDNVRIISLGGLKAAKPIVTRPYPGFPTDAQPPLMAASLKAQGTSVFVENIFENRFRHVDELKRLGADIKVEGRVALVTGGKKLRGAPVKATDLRGGAALVIAALGAEGTTEISELHHIDRGYDGLEYDLRQLGAEISRFD